MTNVELKKEGDLQITVIGRVDSINAGEFEKEMLAMINPKLNMTLDCAALSYVSSAGLRSLLTVQKTMKSQNGSLILSNLTSDIKSLFDMTGFSQLFKIV